MDYSKYSKKNYVKPFAKQIIKEAATLPLPLPPTTPDMALKTSVACAVPVVAIHRMIEEPVRAVDKKRTEILLHYGLFIC
jgi:hypothetical protein